MKTTKKMKKLCGDICLPITSKIMSVNIKHLKQYLNDMCYIGDLDKVKLILNSNIFTICDIDPSYSRNPLYYACCGGNIEVIDTINKVLIRGYSPIDMNEIWLNGLTGVCKGGHIHIFEQYLNKTKHSVKFWNRCLLNSCENGNVELTNFIINKGATDWNGGMYIACENGHTEIVKLMISKGATKWDRCLKGACYGENLEIVELLILKGSDNLDIDCLNEYLKNACRGGNLEIVKLMIEHGATKWSYCIESACYGGNIEVVKLIINNLYNVDNTIHNVDLYSGLIGACEGGHIDVVEFMISKGATKGATDLEDSLKIICEQGNLAIFKLMLLECFSHNIHHDFFVDCLSILCENSNMDIIVYMVNNGIVVLGDVLYYASSAGNLEIVEFAIVEGATNFNECFETACYNGHIDVVKFLINQGADNFNDGLVGACEKNNLETVKLMIKKGADDFNEGLESVDDYNGSIYIVKLLISKGANNLNKGLKVACFRGDLRLAKFLTETGATDFNSGLEMACQGEHKQLVQLMLLCGVINLNEMLNIHANNDYNNDIIIMLINAGANNLQCLSDTNYFKFYCMYCKYAEIRPDNDRYLTLLCKYPAYVLLVGSRVRAGKNSSVKRLPVELFRLLFEY